MSIHPIVVTYDEGVANFKLRPLNSICTCIIKYQIYAILNFYYIVNCVYYVISRAHIPEKRALAITSHGINPAW